MTATTLSDYRASKELYLNLVLRELRSKYKRSFLGWAWSTINPIMLTVVYTVVFSFFLKFPVNRAEPSGLHIFAIFLLCGMLPWNFFQGSVMACVGSLIGSANLIKKTYFPRDLLPAANVSANIVSHAIEMGLLLIALVGLGNWRALAFLPLTLLLIVITAVFALGLGLALSVLNVYFRDVQHFMGLLFQMWFFMTPIVYQLEGRSHKVKTILEINPMTDAVQSFRATLYAGKFPVWWQLGYFALWALAALLIGRFVFARLQGRLAEEL